MDESQLYDILFLKNLNFPRFASNKKKRFGIKAPKNSHGKPYKEEKTAAIKELLQFSFLFFFLDRSIRSTATCIAEERNVTCMEMECEHNEEILHRGRTSRNSLLN